MNNKTMGASLTILKELHENDAQEFKSVMRLLPEQDTVMRTALPARAKLELTLAIE